jgi:3-(3-hydroxy-phenyl)propionate hydroxylase
MTETDWAAWQALDAAAVLISTVSQQTVQVLNPLAHSSVAFQMQERDGLLSAWLAEQGATALLARPDHYVYGLASDLPGLRQQMNELTTQGIQTC